jgi:hypothetical protein
MSTRLPAQRTAFTLIELAVLVFILALVGLLLIPGLLSAKRRGLRATCWENLKQVGLSYRTWSLDSTDRYPQGFDVTVGGSREWLFAGQLYLHFRTMSNELSTPKILVCPADKEKQPSDSFANGFSNSNVSYFASLDASEQFPQVILSGDRNLAVAGQAAAAGNLVLTTNPPVPLSWSKSIHHSCGIVGLADGSVHLLDLKGLPAAVLNQGIATNRLVLP